MESTGQATSGPYRWASEHEKKSQGVNLKQEVKQDCVPLTLLQTFRLDTLGFVSDIWLIKLVEALQGDVEYNIEKPSNIFIKSSSLVKQELEVPTLVN